MKVKELIKILQQLENQDWEIEYVDGEYGNMTIERVDKEEENYVIF